MMRLTTGFHLTMGNISRRDWHGSAVFFPRMTFELVARSAAVSRRLSFAGVRSFLGLTKLIRVSVYFCTTADQACIEIYSKMSQDAGRKSMGELAEVACLKGLSPAYQIAQINKVLFKPVNLDLEDAGGLWANPLVVYGEVIVNFWDQSWSCGHKGPFLQMFLMKDV